MKNFLKGVDISSLPEYLASNEVFLNDQGQPTEALNLLAENGVNSVRVRIWNDPTAIPEARGFCGLSDTIAMGKRIKEHNMHFFLDFHYSDFWADPAKQRKPRAWENLTFEELQQAVYDFTYEVLSTLRDEGCLPDMVQIGNEIRSGLLFPDGAYPKYDNIAKLLNAGIRATRDISPEIDVMIHLDQGGRFYYLRDWFDSVFAAGLDKIDAIGISFYSFWHGTFMDLRDSMRQLIERYQVPVYVVETAHPWRICDGGQVPEEIMRNAGLPAGIEEQVKSLQIVLQIASSMPDGMGGGIYYWEPLCLPGRGYGTWAENMSLMDTDGKVLPALAALRDFTKENPPIPDLDSYIESLYAVDDAQIPPAGTNLIPNSDFSDGDEGWWIEPDGDVTIKVENNEVYVSSVQNYKLHLYRDIHVDRAGHYKLSVDYRGTNTTGVKIFLYLSVITCNGETSYSRQIYPTDVNFVTIELEEMELPMGQIRVGITMDTPPVFGRITNFRLIEV